MVTETPNNTQTTCNVSSLEIIYELTLYDDFRWTHSNCWSWHLKRLQFFFYWIRLYFTCISQCKRVSSQSRSSKRILRLKNGIIVCLFNLRGSRTQSASRLGGLVPACPSVAESGSSAAMLVKKQCRPRGMVQLCTKSFVLSMMTLCTSQAKVETVRCAGSSGLELVLFLLRGVLNQSEHASS